MLLNTFIKAVHCIVLFAHTVTTAQGLAPISVHKNKKKYLLSQINIIKITAKWESILF